MTSLFALWLPILLSAVAVFVVSAVIHMATPWHTGDYPTVPDEARFLAALRPLNLPPGDYKVPGCSSRGDLNSPAFLEKMKQGPVLIMTVIQSGPPKMGSSLIQWFVYCAVVGLFAAYLAGRALPPTAEYLDVFRFAGATAFIGYAVALWQTSIWYKRAWSTTFKVTLDGLLYALVTAGIFGWLWPR